MADNNESDEEDFDPLWVEKVSGIAICKECCVGCPSVRSAEEHLVFYHNICRPGSQVLSKEVFKKVREVNNAPHPLRKEYRESPAPVRSVEEVKLLEPLPFLKIVTGFQCSACERCFSVWGNLASHVTRSHSEKRGITLRTSANHGIVSLQSCFSGARLAYFQVKTPELQRKRPRDVVEEEPYKRAVQWKDLAEDEDDAEGDWTKQDTAVLVTFRESNQT